MEPSPPLIWGMPLSIISNHSRLMEAWDRDMLLNIFVLINVIFRCLVAEFNTRSFRLFGLNHIIRN